jgi:hypothetical protein
MKAIELHIEELVLHGFAPGDRHRIADAIKTELKRLLIETDSSLKLTNAEIELMDAGEFRLTGNASPGAIGALTARAIHRKVIR